MELLFCGEVPRNTTGLEAHATEDRNITERERDKSLSERNCAALEHRDAALCRRPGDPTYKKSSRAYRQSWQNQESRPVN